MDLLVSRDSRCCFPATGIVAVSCKLEYHMMSNEVGVEEDSDKGGRCRAVPRLIFLYIDGG
jgi:hypothetical protein